MKIKNCILILYLLYPLCMSQSMYVLERVFCMCVEQFLMWAINVSTHERHAICLKNYIMLLLSVMALPEIPANQ